MPLQEIDQLLIEKYVDKTLTETELITFNQRRSDTEFAAEIRRYEQAITAVHAFGDSQIKAMLQEEEEKLSAQTTAQTVIAPPSRAIGMQAQYKPLMIPKITRWTAIAASFLVLISVSYWLLKPKKEPIVTEKDKLLAIHFEPYKNYEMPDVREGTAKSDIETAFSFYEKGKYTEALTYFEKISPPQYLDESGLFYKANAYLATQQLEKAIPILEKLSQNANTEWRGKAEWYLVYALSKTQAERSNQILEKIKRDTLHPCHGQAMEIGK